MVEENGTNVIQMAVQGEEAASCLIRPNLDLVIVTTRHKEGLCSVKIDATDRTVVLFESINQSAHTIIPKLNGGRMEGDEDPWSRWAVLAVFESIVAYNRPTSWDERRDLSPEKTWTRTIASLA